MPAQYLSIVAFRQEFPEFVDAGDGLVAAKLAEAHRSFDTDLFGDRYLDAVKYKTAHLIASSPFGRSLRLNRGDGGEGDTIYAASLMAVTKVIPGSGNVIT